MQAHYGQLYEILGQFRKKMNQNYIHVDNIIMLLQKFIDSVAQDFSLQLPTTTEPQHNW